MGDTTDALDMLKERVDNAALPKSGRREMPRKHLSESSIAGSNPVGGTIKEDEK